MLPDVLDPCPNLLPKIVPQARCRADLLEERIQCLRQLAVLIEQFLDHWPKPRLLLQKRSQVPILLLETEMVGEMRPHLREASAQFWLALPGSPANGLLQLPEVPEKVSMCLLKASANVFLDGSMVITFLSAWKEFSQSASSSNEPQGFTRTRQARVPPQRHRRLSR
jgi:hypothetical protein